jgi:putative peptide zinc metalloprotease protein
VWPVFFTDVTDSYRLDRGGRLRTDLGGLYFNMLFALGTVGAWAVTQYDPLLILVPLQVFQMTHQLMPFVRMDGYYILSDLTGVPDLFARIKPTLQSAMPGKPTSERAEALKPWVRVVVTLWVLAVVPILIFTLSLAVIGLPRLLATVGDSLAQQWDGFTRAVGDGDVLSAVAGALGSFMVALPAASILFILTRLVLRVSRGAWIKTEGRPAARVGLVPVAAVLMAGLAWLWWPNGEYEPLRRGERWTIQDTISDVRHLPSGRPGLTADRAVELDNQATTTTVPVTTTTTVDEAADESTETERRRVATTVDRTPTTSTPDTTTPPAEPTETTTP